MRSFPAALERLSEQFARLPGIGSKTAQRLAFYMLGLPQDEAEEFAETILQARRTVHLCPICQNLTDQDVCPICADPRRDKSTICVVENIQDVMAIENTQQYNGVYHVLGGVISPMDGVGPGDLEIGSLVQRVKEDADVREVILALSSTMEGDTTNFYIHRQLEPFRVKVTMMSRGISVGNDLEYTDEVTLGRSIVNRTVMV